MKNKKLLYGLASGVLAILSIVNVGTASAQAVTGSDASSTASSTTTSTATSTATTTDTGSGWQGSHQNQWNNNWHGTGTSTAATSTASTTGSGWGGNWNRGGTGGYGAATSSLQIGIPGAPVGSAAVVRINRQPPITTTTSYVDPLTVKAGDHFSVSGVALPGYTFSVTGQCDLVARGGTSYYCSLNYSPDATSTTSTSTASTTGTLNVGPQDQVVTFTKTFSYSGSSPVTLSILADNGFSVSVNGVQVAVSNSNNNYSSIKTYNITSDLVQGNNTLSIMVDNQWQWDPDNGFSWQLNPGGLDYLVTGTGSSTLASSGASDQASFDASSSSAFVIPLNALGSAWITIPGTSWIWDSALYNQYSTGSTTATSTGSTTGTGGTGTTTSSTTASQSLSFSEVALSPSSGTFYPGDNLTVDLVDASTTDSLLGIDGACTVNGAPVGPLLQVDNNLYNLNYTVSASDQSDASGTVPINCSIADASGASTTVTSFTTPNTVAIQTSVGIGSTTATSTGSTTGSLGGTVSGGTTDGGSLSVTSITPVQTAATADDTYADGWSWTFNVTVPNNEDNLQMEFADWTNTANASDTIPVDGNMQISSPQASTTSPVTLTGSDVYSMPLALTGSATSTTGRQVQVNVQVKVPTDTVNGSYTTTYGVQTY